MKTANYKSIGVIVSRFQVPFLTEGHKSLLDMVSANHGRVIVVLGVSQSTPSSLNPLDFATRAAMVQSAYPEVLVLPLQDYSQDSVWSDNLETLLKSVYATSSFHLYSGRDGFNIAYTGNRPITIVDSVESITGTEIRTEVSSSIKNDYNFRSGVIYGVTNRYPHVNTTVDIAIVKNNETLIVGRKSGETKYQFIGGFVNVNETLEDAAVRNIRRNNRRNSQKSYIYWKFSC
jgi:nicotinamide mononucleotide adenylyltransferase